MWAGASALAGGGGVHAPPPFFCTRNVATAHQWYSDTVRTTIDKAGRVVIPAALRDRAGLVAGAEVDVSIDETGIRIERVAPPPRLMRIGRRLVARPSAPVEARRNIDVAALIEEERNRWP